MWRALKTLNKRNIVVILLAIIIVIGGEAYEYLKPSQNRNTVVINSPQFASMIVTYTKNGFIANKIRVKTNTKVVWKNFNNRPMWVASDPHPTHTNLSGFDQQKIVNIGGEYSYIFTKEGNFKYHNHIIPSDTGEVIVRD